MSVLRTAGLAIALLFNTTGAVAAAQAKDAPVAAPPATKAPAPPPEPIYNLNLFEFKSLVLEAKKPVLLDYWAPWCKPCVRLEAELKKVAADRPDVSVVRLNYDEVMAIYRYLDEKKLARTRQADEFLPESELIESLPTLLYFKDGKLIAANENLRVRQEAGKDIYFNNGHHMTEKELNAAPKDATGLPIEPGEPVNAEAQINIWLRHIDAGTVFPAAQLMPEGAEPEKTAPAGPPPSPGPF